MSDDLDEPSVKELLTAILNALGTINENLVTLANNSAHTLEQIDSHLSDVSQSAERIETSLQSMDHEISTAGNSLSSMETCLTITIESTLNLIESAVSEIQSELSARG